MYLTKEEQVIRALFDRRFPYGVKTRIQIRANCPFCSGENTLSIAAEPSGTLRWNCFRASCVASGTRSSMDDEGYLIELFLHAKDNHETKKSAINNFPTANKSVVDFQKKDNRTKENSSGVNTARPSHSKPMHIPENFKFDVLSYSSFVDYVQQVGLYLMVKQNRIRMAYDQTNNRAVFLHEHRGRICGASGRHLSYSLGKGVSSAPKWYIYSGTSYPFVCQWSYYRPTKTLLLVEDCPSAARAYDAVNVDTCAILGTNITDEVTDFIFSHSNVVVALDKDATDKAYEHTALLNYLKETKILPLEKDIKDMTKEEIKKLFKAFV